MGNLDPSLGLLPSMDLDMNVGEGFELSMTLSDGEFGKYFSDDAFFGAMISSLGSGLDGFDSGM